MFLTNIFWTWEMFMTTSNWLPLTIACLWKGKCTVPVFIPDFLFWKLIKLPKQKRSFRRNGPTSNDCLPYEKTWILVLPYSLLPVRSFIRITTQIYAVFLCFHLHLFALIRISNSSFHCWNPCISANFEENFHYIYHKLLFLLLRTLNLF